jgi:hypothetical protein
MVSAPFPASGDVTACTRISVPRQLLRCLNGSCHSPFLNV